MTSNRPLALAAVGLGVAAVLGGYLMFSKPSASQAGASADPGERVAVENEPKPAAGLSAPKEQPDPTPAPSVTEEATEREEVATSLEEFRTRYADADEALLAGVFQSEMMRTHKLTQAKLQALMDAGQFRQFEHTLGTEYTPEQTFPDGSRRLTKQTFVPEGERVFIREAELREDDHLDLVAARQRLEWIQQRQQELAKAK